MNNNIYDIFKAMEEIDCFQHDGSYELVQKTIEKYSLLDNLDNVSFVDLDLIYVMSTIQTKKDRYINKINDCNLPENYKEDLKVAVDIAWEKTENHEYENVAKNELSIGMVSAGFSTFNKSNNDSSLGKNVINILIGIYNASSEDEAYSILDSIDWTIYKGLGVASFSIMAHCLKPSYFPIINSNEGFGTIFNSLGINVSNGKLLAEYTNDCRKIRQYRDANFEFKNYRVMDQVARMEKGTYALQKEKKMSKFYIVMQSPKNFNAESVGGYIEAPRDNIKTHKKVSEVKKDDIIFHWSEQSIKAVSSAIDVYDSTETTLYHTPCNYRVLSKPVEVDEIGRQKIHDICEQWNADGNNSPFNLKPDSRNGSIANAKQGYLYELPKDLIGPFIYHVKDKNPGQNWKFLDDAAKSLGIIAYSASKKGVKNMKEIRSVNTILYGPPGTGKTYNTKLYAVSICNGATAESLSVKNYDDIVNEYDKLVLDGRVCFTTFHQSYGYEEFIEGIKAKTTSSGNISYDIEAGVFKEFCEKAKGDMENNYVFIIDEINRGNISKIFGELITLIEESKRYGNPESMECKLPYSKKSFTIPKNVYLLGTMNTADRSINLMDTALRRRFDFIEMLPNTDIIRGTVVDGINIEELLSKINKRIEVLYDRDHTIGHAFFTGLTSSSKLDDLALIFENKIIPLLQEYFYEDYEKIQMVLGDNSKSNEDYKFIKDIKNDSTIFKGAISLDDLAEKRYEINKEAFLHIESFKEIYE